MDTIKIIAYKMIRALMHLFCFFTIKNNRILFESYKGNAYTCNPKYISECLADTCKNDCEIIWVLNKSDNSSLPKDVRIVKKNSFWNFYYHMTSKIIVSNRIDDIYIPLRKGQVFINTWHAGGAYKRVGLPATDLMTKWDKWENSIVNKETTYYVSSSELFTKYNIIEAYNFHGRIIKSGMPRNDIFFNTDKMDVIKNKICTLYGIHNKIVILYAPTFRGDFGKAENLCFDFPFEDIIERLNKDCKRAVILNRSHYAVKTTKNLVYQDVIDVTGYPDMQDLLVTANILVTDYSSSIWDYSLTGKPCILFVPDKDKYLQERGTFTPMEEWPGKVVLTKEELVESIVHPDIEFYKLKAQKALSYFGSYEKGLASNTIVSLIKKECGI